MAARSLGNGWLGPDATQVAFPLGGIGAGTSARGALTAAEALAERVGKPAQAAQYRSFREQSARRLDTLLWNGEYYRQVLPAVNAHPYQHGNGCLSDQLLGQLRAHVAHLGYLLPPERVRAALDAIYRYNVRRPLGTHVTLQRAYAFADESGLLLCSWPRGGRPPLPFVYADEVWPGVEYPVAAHLIYEGWVRAGRELAAAVQARHDSYRRNPWNEFECGSNYAGALVSRALLPALSGFSCDVDRQMLRFTPALHHAHVRSLFTCGAGWGIYEQTEHGDGNARPSVTALGGNRDGSSIEVGAQTWHIAGAQVVDEGRL